MSQQSETTDLIGGFKPVELNVLCAPIINKFLSVFPKTFSRTVNKKKKRSKKLKVILFFLHQKRKINCLSIKL